MEEFRELINKTEDIAIKASSQFLLINSLILKAKFAMISDGLSGFESASEFFDRALKLSSKMGVDGKVKYIHREIRKMKHILGRSIEQNLDEESLRDYIGEAMKIVQNWNHDL